ncbi:MAG: nucleotidyltransferase substrate binding protein [Kiritimatiellales bacterium]
MNANKKVGVARRRHPPHEYKTETFNFPTHVVFYAAMKEEQDIRWKQRFRNFDRAFVLLRGALEEADVGEFNPLEQEGLVQRFEYTFELAWKTAKDYLIENGATFLEITPRSVIKEAFAAGIIKDGDVFMKMMLDRNLMSHCYDFAKFLEVIGRVKTDYLPALGELHDFFLGKII